ALLPVALLVVGLAGAGVHAALVTALDPVRLALARLAVGLAGPLAALLGDRLAGRHRLADRLGDVLVAGLDAVAVLGAADVLVAGLVARLAGRAADFLVAGRADRLADGVAALLAVLL